MKVDAKAQERLGAIIFYVIVGVLGYLVFRVFEPFIVPLAWAAVLVVVASPIYDDLKRRWGGTRASLVSTLGVTLVIILPTVAVMYAFAQQGVGAVHAIQQRAAEGRFAWVNHAWSEIQRRFPELGSESFADTLRGWAEAIAGYAAARLGTILAHAAGFFFDLFVTILVMFYLFRDSQSILARLRDVLPFQKEQSDRMFAETVDLIFASVMSTAAAALTQGLLGGIAFAALGIGAPIFWGVMVAFLSLVPVVGSALIWVPAAVTLMVGGHIVKGIVLLALYGLVIIFADYVVRPWVISGRAEMGGLIVFISVLGGVKVFGLLGIVLGPIVVALAASLLDFYGPGSRHGNGPGKAPTKSANAVLE
jgi:predicted PurR-regulated permease PerM